MIKQFLIVMWGLGGLSVTAMADELPTSPVQQYLKAAEYARGEIALNLQLDANPADDEARFGLGVIQFMRAIEKVGQCFYEYGAKTARLPLSFSELPIPHNDQPATVSYKELQRVSEIFIADLKIADETLAQITNPEVKLKLLLSEISFDFTRSGKQQVAMSEILKRLNGARPLFPENNAAIRIHFDRGDVAWLRAYCHLLSSMAELTLTVVPSPGGEDRFLEAFPKRDPVVLRDPAPPHTDWLAFADISRLRRIRLHLVAVCELNRETWKHIRQETDDDFEWLSNPKQKDQLGLPISDAQITGWLNAMAEFEKLLKGETLLGSELFFGWAKDFPEDKGLNLRKVLDDPPADLLDANRLQTKGVDSKYLEPLAQKQRSDPSVFFSILNLFGGPFGFARAARMN